MLFLFPRYECFVYLCTEYMYNYYELVKWDDIFLQIYIIVLIHFELMFHFIFSSASMDIMESLRHLHEDRPDVCAKLMKAMTIMWEDAEEITNNYHPKNVVM